MRRIVLIVLICLVTSVVFAQAHKVQPLNVKTGLWQVTATSSISGLPPIPPDMQARLDQMTPEQRAAIMSRFGGAPHTTTYKDCVTQKDLNTNAFSGPDQKCKWDVLTSTGSDMEVRGGSCEAGRNQGMNTDVDVKLHAIDSEDVKGWVHGTATGNGRTVNISNTFTGKWLSATCPAGTQ